MKNYPANFIESFDDCPLLTKKGDSMYICSDVERCGEIFIFDRKKGNLEIPGYGERLGASLTDMLETCHSCPGETLHNPIIAVREICINKCGQMLTNYHSAGILIEGPECES
jgi:hypothetical protein